MISQNNRGSAMIIALIVLILLTIMSTVFIEKLVRFSEASDGIENSNIAYYQALGMIEETLYNPSVNKYTPWNVVNSGSIISTGKGKSIVVSTGATTIPDSGKGNSPYDPQNKNYNIIALGEPVQVVIPNGIMNWGSINFEFRVPVTESGALSATGVDMTKGLSGAILWTLASSGASLFASGETNIFRVQDININNVTISTKQGKTNSGSSETFANFYQGGYMGVNGSDCTGYKCTLKLSLIRPIPLTSGRTISFLEYRISGFPSAIPSQYMTLHAEGYANGFLRTKEIQFPQITTNTALDFAVLQ